MYKKLLYERDLYKIVIKNANCLIVLAVLKPMYARTENDCSFTDI
jgi:hypothetical protein